MTARSSAHVSDPRMRVRLHGIAQNKPHRFVAQQYFKCSNLIMISGHNFCFAAVLRDFAVTMLEEINGPD